MEDNTPDATAVNAKSDFVRGSTILFEDDFSSEQMGEFPSKWDVVRDGNAETAILNGKKYLNFSTDYNSIQPLMKNMNKYLPDVFTLEWDVFCSKQGDYGQSDLELNTYAGTTRVGHIKLTFRPGNPDYYGNAAFMKANSDSEVYNGYDWNILSKIIKLGQWNHFALSFNKRALKVYINGVRIISQPNVAAPDRFEFFCNGDYKYKGFTNLVLAAGAVDLYERTTTDLSAVEKAIMETGKFVTNNILFETGKATLKPESMSEIQKVADYMKKNPSVRFEVQGHTDNQGSDAVNDPLSQQRAESVVKALVGLGCDEFNLRAVGKGSHDPVADNKSEDGRAKNGRVHISFPEVKVGQAVICAIAVFAKSSSDASLTSLTSLTSHTSKGYWHALDTDTIAKLPKDELPQPFSHIHKSICSKIFLKETLIKSIRASVEGFFRLSRT